MSAALRSAGSRRLAVAGSRARALAALASAETAGVRSERERWEKGLGEGHFTLYAPGWQRVNF